jgi:hypothetical protein
MKRLHSQWQDIADKKLGSKLKPCPECGSTARNFKSVVKANLGYEEVARTGPGTPGEWLLVVACSGCHFVRLFDADKLGMVSNA